MVDSVKLSERHLRAHQAKEFLISQVFEEAEIENVPLSEVERKMLSFSETDETLPNMAEIGDQFERDYNTATYEKKIAVLLHNALERNRRESPDAERRWKQAITDLRKEDHYLLVMVDQASRSVRPPGDQIKLWSTGIAVVGVLVAAALLTAKYNVDLDKYFPSRAELSILIWGTAAVLAIVYAALWLLLGKQRMDKLFVKIIEMVFASSRDK